MTWQRIDENTYIDDTLVTCAEYQLFIDEMREQEEYYQPDHWTSYQFSESYAKEPILGIRQSDAEKFCKWLTQREDDKWAFRMPNLEEASMLPIKPIGKSVLGYWNTESHQFTWVKSISSDKLSIYKTVIEALANKDAKNSRYSLNIEYYIDMDLALGFHNNFFEAMLEGGIEIHRFTNELNRAHILDRVYILGNALNNALDSARKRVIIRLFADPLDSLEISLDTYISIYNLHQRLNQRSPAFEGIRLVKYREQS